ncbi:MAG: hypothetical protein GF418_17555 [Chitinivibrionales bacterium]|nr:hypothetical protein [Chitinivibrionales bacterium]MBD3397428.1 hypothetical protein [Chitinivibrionales bacterium]
MLMCWPGIGAVLFCHAYRIGDTITGANAFPMIQPFRYVTELTRTYFLRRGPLLARGIAFSFVAGAIPLLVLALYIASTLFAIVPQLRATLVLRLDALLPPEVAMAIQTQAVEIASHSWAEIGLLTLLILVLVAQGIFASIEGGLSMIMRCPQERHLWLDNLLYITLTLLAIILFFSASYIHMFIGMVYDFAGFPGGYRWFARKTTSLLVMWLALVMIYRVCYHGRMHIMALLGVSFCVAFLWLLLNEAASSVITSSGQRELIYGFLASVVVFLIWAYMFAVLLLAGGIVIARHSGRPVRRLTASPDSAGRSPGRRKSDFSRL